MLSPAAIRESLMKYVSEEVACEAFAERVACDTPLYYPDGDSVVVYARGVNEEAEVTDHGEGYVLATSRRGIWPKTVKAAAQEICQGLGVRFEEGRVITHVPREQVADAIWSVASASLRIAEAPTFMRRGLVREELFAEEVERFLKGRKISVQREPALTGASGHEHKPTLYVPSRQLVLEPFAADSPWIRATSIYAEFGDLAQANGYRMVAILDDRSGEIPQVTKLLSQVGDIAYWTKHDQWVRTLS